MLPITRETIDLLEMLPEKEQILVNELIKRVVIAWDPDFTKLTPRERERLDQANREVERGELVSHEDINWD